MKKIILFLLIVFNVKASAQTKSELQNDTTYFPNKKPSTILIRINEKNAKETTYYESGKIKSEGLKKDGFQVGEWRSYYESGNLAVKGSFIRSHKPNKCYKKWPNPKEGKWVFYNESGKIVFKVWYKNGHTKRELQYDENQKIVMRYRNYWWERWDFDSSSPYKPDF